MELRVGRSGLTAIMSSPFGPIATGKIEDLIDELKGSYSLPMVTHNMQQAARPSDFTAFVCLGRLVEYGPSNDIFRNPRLEETEDYVTGRLGWPSQAPSTFSAL